VALEGARRPARVLCWPQLIVGAALLCLLLAAPFTFLETSVNAARLRVTERKSMKERQAPSNESASGTKAHESGQNGQGLSSAGRYPAEQRPRFRGCAQKARFTDRAKLAQRRRAPDPIFAWTKSAPEFRGIAWASQPVAGFALPAKVVLPSPSDARHLPPAVQGYPGPDP